MQTIATPTAEMPPRSCVSYSWALFQFLIAFAAEKVKGKVSGAEAFAGAGCSALPEWLWETTFHFNLSYSLGSEGVFLPASC